MLQYSVNDLVDHFYKTQLWKRKGIIINMLINSIALNIFFSMNASKVSLFFAWVIPLFLMTLMFHGQFKDIVRHQGIKMVPVSASLMSTRFIRHTIFWVYLAVFPLLIIVLGNMESILFFLLSFKCSPHCWCTVKSSSM